MFSLLELPGDADAIATPHAVREVVRQEGVEVAVVEDGHAHRVQRHAPLPRRRVLRQLLQQELLRDVLEPDRKKRSC